MPSSAAQHASGTHTRKQITIGDITITNFTSSRAVQGAGGFHITGSGTTANVPDPQSQSTLVLHADEIDGMPDGKDAAGNLELSGHISYTIDQVQKGDKRHMSGTAGHIEMRRSEGRVRLTDMMHVNITDTSTLSEPAVVNAENAIIDLKARPYMLIVDGSEQISDITFVPRRASTSGGADRIHMSQFSHGEFRPGVAAAFTGKRVRAEITDPASGDTALLYSSSIVSEFDHTILTKVRSSVPVTYHAEQRLASGKVEQSADGSAQTAELHVPDRLLLLSGRSRVHLNNAARLVGPGTFVSDVASLDLSARPYRYSADGPADLNSLQFTVRPADGSKQGPLSVHIFGYLRMMHATEQTVEFTGPYTTLDMVRQTPRSASHVLCSDLKIRMMPGIPSIERIVATDHVQYRLTSAITTSQDRTLTGTADSVEITLPPRSAGAPALRESLQKMALHAVKCKLDSPDWLIGEATLRAADVEQITEDGQTRLTITGDPASTDLFAPMRAGAVSTNPVRTGSNVLHLYRFQRAQLNKDGSLFEAGPHSVLDINQTPAKRTSHIQGDQINLTVDQATKSPLIATAYGRVIMTTEEPADINSGKGALPSRTRRLEASCDKAVYSITRQRIVLDGGVTGRLTDSKLLVEPCDIRADTVTVGLQTPYSTLDLHDTGSAGRAPAADVRMALLLKPTAATTVQRTEASPKPPVPTNRIMRVHLYRFHDAEFEVGVGASAEGAGTTLDADRSDGAIRMKLTARSVSMRLSADGQALDSAKADGTEAGDRVVFDAQSVRASGVQSVNGTAENVIYLGVLDQIRANGLVNAVFTDPLTLAPPGSLRTESMTVDIGLPQFVYNCSGDPSVNDIDFTTLKHDKQPPASAFGSKAGAVSPKPPVQSSVHTDTTTAISGPVWKTTTQLRVHAYSFDNAVLQAGSAMALTGPISHLDMAQVTGEQKQKHSDSQIRAPHISASFSDTGDTLSAARAEDGVQFVFNMPTASGLAEQSYSGFASSLDYTLLQNTTLQNTGQAVQHQNIDMTGRLSIKVVNPEELSEPGLVEGLDGRVLHMTISNGVAQYSWDGGDNPITMLLRPKQRPAKSVPTDPQRIRPNLHGRAP